MTSTWKSSYANDALVKVEDIGDTEFLPRVVDKSSSVGKPAGGGSRPASGAGQSDSAGHHQGFAFDHSFFPRRRSRRPRAVLTEAAIMASGLLRGLKENVIMVAWSRREPAWILPPGEIAGEDGWKSRCRGLRRSKRFPERRGNAAAISGELPRGARRRNSAVVPGALEKLTRRKTRRSFRRFAFWDRRSQ